MKKGTSAKHLVLLLERGIAFDGNKYMTPRQFETKIKGKSRTLPYLELGRYLRESDMVRIVPVEAPKNYTANVKLRKGGNKDASLPVVLKRTEIETDYPYLTRKLGEAIGKNTNFVAKAAVALSFKGYDKYHQAVRSSKSGEIHRYSEAAKTRLEQTMAEDPSFNPYKLAKRDA